MGPLPKHRCIAGVVALLLALGAPILLAPSASAAADPLLRSTPGGDLNAEATVDGPMWTAEPVSSTSGCSGFFVTGTGHIVTAGHCVDPASAREDVIETFVGQQVDQGLLTPAEAQGILPDALVNWTVEGLADGSPMTRVIQAVQPTAVPAAALQGDVALLRVETTNAVPLPIATADPRSGSALGNVLGVNSFGPSRETQSFNFITDTTDLRDWMGEKNLLAPPRTAPAGPADPQATPAAGGGWASIPAWVWALVGAGAVALVGLAALLVHGRSRGSAPYPTAPATATTVGTPHWDQHRPAAPYGQGAAAAWQQSPTAYSPPQGRTPETRRPRCQEPTIATARFCMNCGTPLHG